MADAPDKQTIYAAYRRAWREMIERECGYTSGIMAQTPRRPGVSR
jgi:hypothetical protein